MYTEQEVALFKRSGKIAAEMLEFGKGFIKKGAKPLDILNKIEAKIKESGADCAFPPQISVNDVAAHSCPDADDTGVLGDDIVKLDVGVHVDGYVSDNAMTIDLTGKWKELLKANTEALHAALKLAVPGTRVSEIGKTVHDIIQSYGYRPVKNLSGHGIGRYKIHMLPSIPNIPTNEATVLKQGMALAIEPFASTGSGIVFESGDPGVFMVEHQKPVRDAITRNVLKHIEQYKGLPFARKWLTQKFGSKTNFALRQLIQNGIIKGYPPLVDSAHGMISQMEKSVIVAEKPIIITQV